MMCSENIKRETVMTIKMLLVVCVSLSSIGLMWAEAPTSQVDDSAEESVWGEKIENSKVRSARARKQTLSSYVTAFKNLVWGAGTFSEHYLRRLLVIFGPALAYYLLQGEGSGASGSDSKKGAKSVTSNLDADVDQEITNIVQGVCEDAASICRNCDDLFKKHIATEAARMSKREAELVAFGQQIDSLLQRGQLRVQTLQGLVARRDNSFAQETSELRDEAQKLLSVYRAAEGADRSERARADKAYAAIKDACSKRLEKGILFCSNKMNAEKDEIVKKLADAVRQELLACQERVKAYDITCDEQRKKHQAVANSASDAHAKAGWTLYSLGQQEQILLRKRAQN